MSDNDIIMYYITIKYFDFSKVLPEMGMFKSIVFWNSSLIRIVFQAT